VPMCKPAVVDCRFCMRALIHHGTNATTKYNEIVFYTRWFSGGFIHAFCFCSLIVLCGSFGWGGVCVCVCGVFVCEGNLLRI